MKITSKLSLGLLCGMTMAAFFSCQENIDTSNRYVFRERTIAGYLSDHEQFSDYVRLLKEQKVSKLSETSVYQLMTAYGAYTCFAPTNEALQLYLDSLVIKKVIPVASWDSIPDKQVKDSLRRVVVMNSILDGTEIDKVFPVADFPLDNEEFSVSTMEDMLHRRHLPRVDQEQGHRSHQRICARAGLRHRAKQRDTGQHAEPVRL